MNWKGISKPTAILKILLKSEFKSRKALKIVQTILPLSKAINSNVSLMLSIIWIPTIQKRLSYRLLSLFKTMQMEQHDYGAVVKIQITCIGEAKSCSDGQPYLRGSVWHSWFDLWTVEFNINLLCGLSMSKTFKLRKLWWFGHSSVWGSSRLDIYILLIIKRLCTVGKLY